jgi:predicted CXXCH cytochrome family protein
MEVLIRYVRQASSGVSDFLDTAVAVDEITIGSAADSTLQLLGQGVASTHAVIRRSGSELSILCRRGNRVIVNGKQTTSGTLAVGDQIELAGHRLKLFAPPSGFDVAIEVRPDTRVAASDFEAAFRTDLNRTWLSMRPASWILALAAAAVGLAIPLLTISLHRHGLATPPALPDDTLWSSGPLSPEHAHAAGNQCNACHQQLFVRVKDQACLECHKTTRDHVSPEHRLLTSLSDQRRCGECHAEHRERASRLALGRDQLCVACHADPDKNFGRLRIQKVSGFQSSEHPAFSVALQKLSGTPGEAMSDLRWRTYRVSLAGAFEQSNLKFSHAQHLDANKVTRSSGTGALGCADCHILAADGEHFQPLTMAKTCSTCHELNFDLSAPNRQLPHGKPFDAMLMIEDYFARKYSDPPPATSRTLVRRLPDLERDPSRQSEVDTCIGAAVTCARQRARAEIENQFTGRGCVSCHVVVDNHSADLHDRFQVTPIRLGYEYFPEARFPHKTHEIQGKRTGDAACESCHAARKSTQARNLLLPDIDRCLACHRDRQGARASAAPARQAGNASDLEVIGETPKIVTLQCISCHLYHPTAIMAAARGAEKNE